MNAKNKKRLKRALRSALKAVLTKKAYCIYVEKKHDMEYRSTTVEVDGLFGTKRYHINSCSNCKHVSLVAA